jgi:serine/threonine protein kinase
VQEFIDGPNLLEAIAQQGVFSDRQVWQLLDDLLPVLEFIHHHQVIHRDIKPQNIIGAPALSKLNSMCWWTLGQPSRSKDRI